MKITRGSTRRHYLARISLLLIIVALVVGMSGFDVFRVDDISASQNLEIRTWYDLDSVRDNMSGNHTLMNDLDSTTPGYTELASPTANGGKGWRPIGYVRSKSGCGAVYTRTYGLSGTFNGQGYEIRDLFINRDESAVGLFAYLLGGGVIKNLGVANTIVVGQYVVGSLVASMEGGTIDNCYFSGNVAGNTRVGGLVGINSGNVSNSYATGSVTGNEVVGGLVGQLSELHTIGNSYSSCRVVGGAQSVYSTIGGLVGKNYGGPVISSFWNMETSGQSISAGGTGKNTTEMQDITTFSEAGWDIIAVALNETNPAYIWNIVNNVTYPFLSWQS
ncbi:MAG: GLUG motif-containing protein [Promethearchaeati archaeon]